MTSLNPDKLRKVVASARLMGSNHQGERQAALEAVIRLLPQDVNLADVIERGLAFQAPPKPQRPPIRETEHWYADGTPKPMSPSRKWQMKARWLLLSPLKMTDYERRFVKDMILRMSEPTQRQQDWLDTLHNRAQELRR